MSRLHTAVLIAVAGLALGACAEESSEPEAPAQPAETTTTQPDAPANSMDADTSGADMEQAASDTADAAQQAVDDAAEQATEAADAVTAEARAAMEGFLTQMEAAVGALSDIDTQLGAAAKSPELRGIIEQMQGFRDQLGALPDETLSALRSEFDAQLSGLTERLQTEIDRITNDPDLAGTLGGLLDQIPTSIG